MRPVSGTKAHETDMQEIHDTATELDIAVKTPSGAMGEKDQHSVKDGDHVDTNTTNSNKVGEPLDACSSKNITYEGYQDSALVASGGYKTWTTLQTVNGTKTHETEVQEIDDAATELDSVVKTLIGLRGGKDKHSIFKGDQVNTKTATSNTVCEPTESDVCVLVQELNSDKFYYMTTSGDIRPPNTPR